MIDNLIRRDTSLDLILRNEEELSRHVKFVAVLAAVSIIWWNSGGGNKANSRIATMDLRRAGFSVVRGLLGRVS